MAPRLFLRDINLTLGVTPLLAGAELAVSPGERIALVGRNGSGKSTLLRIATGEIAPDAGECFVQPGLRVAYLEQAPDFAGFASALDFAAHGLDETETYRARAMLDEAGLDANADPRHFSGGEARRAAIAKALAGDPELLLLDEPTNHLDIVAIEWLERKLKDSRAAFVLISHDRRLLGDLTNAVVWLDRGLTRRLDRGFAHFEAWRDQTLEIEEIERHKLGRKIKDEEHWMRYGVTARRKRNMRRVGELATLRDELKTARTRPADVVMSAQDSKPSGTLAVELTSATKALGERTLVKNLSFRLLRGDRLGVVGPNGVGKTTLLKLFTGKLAPDSGEVAFGARLAAVTLDQFRAELPPTTTVVDALTGGGSDYIEFGGERKHVIGYMRDFLFQPEQARTPISRLSGGERGRLMLARAFAAPSNLLALDEPTNDLDIETLDVLQEMLGTYPGTILVVSHDRDFLDRVATEILFAEGDGTWTAYAGGYSDLERQRGSGVVAAAGRPVEAAPKAERAAAVKRKLSFRDQRALDMLPGRIGGLRARLGELETEMGVGGAAARIQALSAQYAAAKAEMETAEEEWLRLEMLKEEMEGR
ncbi:MAG TPA: ATP-binding cassette domain-containing protein [Roseiarcus sp.]|nr:ATP-binding cassette domain-containing protein [Roseiarcus sp.]